MSKQYKRAKHSIQYWIERQLPEPFKTKALKYVHTPLYLVSSLKEALQKGFLHSKTKEGRIYWTKVIQHYNITK